MADFCKKCSIEHFGEDFGDLTGICLEGQVVETICEGCGWIKVDHQGNEIPPKLPTGQKLLKTIN